MNQSDFELKRSRLSLDQNIYAKKVAAYASTAPCRVLLSSEVGQLVIS